MLLIFQHRDDLVSYNVLVFAMYMCCRGIDFISVPAILRLDLGTVLMFFFNKFSFHFSNFSEYLAYFFLLIILKEKLESVYGRRATWDWDQPMGWSSVGTGISLWIEINLALGSAYGSTLTWHWNRPMDGGYCGREISLWAEVNLTLGSAYGMILAWHCDQPMDGS